MSVTLFGSCRINGIDNNNNLNNLISFTHSTKEILQIIKFLLGDLKITSPFNILCFRTAILNNKPILLDSNLNKLFSDSKVCVIEICSEKKYVYENYYLHHLCVDKLFASRNRNTPKIILDNYKCIKQTPAEIEEDILEIKRLLEPRKILFTTHYNSKHKGAYLESRNNLIKLLEIICQKYNIPLINPTIVLKDYDQEKVMKQDLGHYTSFGIAKISEYLNNKISKLLSS